MNKYDVIIIGAGPSGIFCAYELMRQKPDMKVLMIEKGRSIEKRQCPKRTTKVCVGCKPCSITTGFAGAGAFSDGKLSLSPDVGGTLPEILGYEKAEELIKEGEIISKETFLQYEAMTLVNGIKYWISKHRNEISAEEAVKFYEFLVSHSLIDIIGQDTMDKVIN